MTGYPSPQQAPSPYAVLFYDGECGLCNASVRFLLRIDRRERLHFAPLQGSTAQTYLRAKGLPTTDFDSMIFVPDWSRRESRSPLFRTDAVLAALAEIGGSWQLLTFFRIVPQGIRDAFYRIVARLRYHLWGKAESCALSRPEWKERLLP